MLIPSLIRALTIATLLAVATPVRAQDVPGNLTLTPVVEPAGTRFILMVLDQSDSDVTKSRTTLNVLLDTRTGKTWALTWGVKPDSNERGYVWSEIPFATAP